MSTQPPKDCSFPIYREKTPAITDIQNIQYADDLTLVAETREEFQVMLDTLDRTCMRWGMNINGAKTKIMSIGAGTDDDQPAITLRGNAMWL